ncbi:MAG: hypothetical protein WEB06_03100 [Actinomycetota bacterium]
MKSPGIRIGTTLLAFALAFTACGPASKTDPKKLPELPTTQAATLGASMELLFREHVYLLGISTENAVTGQTKGFEAAVEALEQNTLVLADEFEKAYGDRGQKGFLTAWRPYIDLIGQYASGKARKLALPLADRTFAQAVGRIASFAGGLTPLINPRVMGVDMRDVMGAIRAAVDAQVAKDFKKADASLRTAAKLASEVGAVFARAFADDLPAIYPGDPSSPAAGFRRTLAAHLTDHVYLLAMTTENILTKQSGPRDGAKAALDAVSADLGKQIGASYGPEAEKAFVPVWKRQIDLLISYAGTATDKTKHEKARQDLEQFATDAGAFLEGLNKELDKSSMEQIIGGHGDAMTQTIDAQVAGDFKKADLRLRAAILQIEALGLALANATVRRFPVRFQPTPTGLGTP